jgi:hypothetical protein
MNPEFRMTKADVRDWALAEIREEARKEAAYADLFSNRRKPADNSTEESE